MFRRWIALLLLCWLPLQGAYAMAASYCAHEAGPASHVGHHEHQHADTRTAGGAGTAALDGAGGVGGADNDCAHCHLACACALPCQADSGSIRPLQGAPVTFDAPHAWRHPDPLERIPLARPLTLA